MKLASSTLACSEADAEVGREVGEVPGVLVQALVGIDAELAGLLQPQARPGPSQWSSRSRTSPSRSLMCR